MTAERLLAHYEKIADAPDAIARLRRFILDLATRGKLVPQDAKDEPASELLKRIAKEKARLDRKERTKREPENLHDDAKPMQMPKGWTLAPLADLVTILNGRAYKQNELLSAGTPVLRVGNLFTSDKWYYSTLQLDEDKYCEKGDLIFAWSASFGPFIWDGEKVIYHYHIWKLPLHSESDLNKLYLYNFLLQKTREIKEAGHGISMIHMTKEKMEKLVVPLPPLAEQHRIVAKVDVLMELCDRLEAARAAREEARDQLAAASLARLNAPDPETFQADARFALDALPALTTRPDQIKRLRQAILNLAVRGKLVPQDASNEPASELLKRIVKEIPASKTGKSGMGPPPYGAPQGWVWTPLGKLVAHSDAGWSPKTHDHPRSGEEWGVLKVSAVSWDKFRAWANKQVLSGTEPRLQAEVKQGDFLISRANTAELIARAVLVDEPPFKLMMSDKIVRLRLSENCSHRFVWMVNNYADFAREHYVRHASGVSPSMKNVSRDVILSLPFPLPPLAEQHRIVAKVDELMALCDRLEASLSATAATRRSLLDALLAEALAPAEERTLSVNARAAANNSIEPKEVTFTERSAYILSLAYERHRAARRDKSFGHVKAQKILHLVEAKAEFELGRTPTKDAAGPNDFRHMLAVEEWAMKNKRFAFEKSGEGYSFKKLNNFQHSLRAENQPEASKRKQIERIIDICVSLDMQEAELVATVYAAWNNLLIEGKAPTDTEIVRAARDDWHPNKLKVPSEKFFAALRRLRSTKLLPSGGGKFVHGTIQESLFN